MTVYYITFHSVSDSLALERQVKKQGLDWLKLVPVPREISSSCGVAARFDPEHLPAVELLLKDLPFQVEGIHPLDQTQKKSLMERLREKRQQE